LRTTRTSLGHDSLLRLRLDTRDPFPVILRASPTTPASPSAGLMQRRCTNALDFRTPSPCRSHSPNSGDHTRPNILPLQQSIRPVFLTDVGRIDMQGRREPPTLAQSLLEPVRVSPPTPLGALSLAPALGQPDSAPSSFSLLLSFRVAPRLALLLPMRLADDWLLRPKPSSCRHRKESTLLLLPLLLGGRYAPCSNVRTRRSVGMRQTRVCRKVSGVGDDSANRIEVSLTTTQTQMLCSSIDFPVAGSQNESCHLHHAYQGQSPAGRLHSAKEPASAFRPIRGLVADCGAASRHSAGD
jgi:hypothetical protein